jgi:hypothetical protein
MFKKIFVGFFMFLLLTGCSSDITFTKDNGEFSKTKSDVITSGYKIKSTDGFFSSIDFELKEGKVELQIINPKGTVVFEGYAVNENGITYRQLTYPANYSEELNKKEEVKAFTDTKGDIHNIPDFNYLQFGVGSVSGVYTLKLKPSNAEGKYTVTWSNGLLKK